MSDHFDAVIIGGGHNGLVCAWYLARGGLKVKVLERRAIVGGAAVTEEFHPGFRNSVASYTVSLLNPKVIADMRLSERGLRVVERPISNFLPQADGGYLKLGGGLERTQAEFRKFSNHDAEVLPAYYDALDQQQFPVVRGLALNRDDLLRRTVIMALMCQGALQYESVDLAYLISFKHYFAAELRALQPLQEQGMVTLDDNGIQVTERGWFFVRAVAMVFDRALQTDRTRAQFSRIL